ncbi:imidazole glycerol phosphate synthase subunit HisH [Polaromonas sp.]|uniref:imidazole glycerol phosphate synthase subunit HisH n=1 Tax=Polaromonas sp. TaxID=1869339 RepID=UPI003BAC8770
MRPPTIGIVDYGVGNLASVWHALHALGYRCRVSRDPQTLDQADLLLLPGVGAFPVAMAALHRHGLAGYLQAQAREGRPILGICLGMQLLTDASSEHRTTDGLGLIPGQVRPIEGGHWHIGWNNLEAVQNDPLLGASQGHAVYFNHSYAVDTPARYQLCTASVAGTSVTAAIRRGNVVGLQFHPEKSQAAGHRLLRNIVEGFCPWSRSA